MARRTILHIGTMKSGTSHIQSRLFSNRAALLEAGVLVPGKKWADQVHGVTDLLRTQRRGADAANGDWRGLAEKIEAHAGTSVISMEFLGPSPPRVIAGIASTVPGTEAVITVRDLNRTLAAMWQETIQNGSTWAYRDYLDSVRTGRPGVWSSSERPPPPGRSFWRQQDVVRMVRDWQAHVPVTLITVPPPGGSRTLLWERFCQVLGVPGEGWAEARRSNESIGAASATVLRQLNQAIADGGHPSRTGRPLRKHHLAKRVLAGRKPAEPGIGLPVAPWVEEHAHGVVDQLRALGPKLLGDLAELDPVPVPGIDPDDADPREVVDAAVAALVGVVTHEPPRARRR